MNKILLILFMIPCLLFGQNLTYIPDDNFEAYLENNGMGNGIQYDDSVFTSSIDTVTLLNISGGAGSAVGIFDLTGIEDFTNLIELNVINNNIISLDMSNNLNLEILKCDWNNIGSSGGTLNINLNSALRQLWCNSNNITNLDVSNNLSLEELHCESNQLSSLDLTNNISLEELNCGWNSFFNSINLNNNVNLKTLSIPQSTLPYLDLFSNINLEYLGLSRNNLANIDLSNNVLLKELYLNENMLTELNVINNSFLINIECDDNNIDTLNLSNLINLVSISAANNDLKFIDVSNSLSLEEFDINSFFGQVSCLDFSNHVNLTYLDVWGHNNLVFNNGQFTIKNGNWGDFSLFYVRVPQPTVSPNGCIEVDNIEFAVQWYGGHPNQFYSINCNYNNVCNSNLEIQESSYLKNKTIFKIFDILGRETEDNKNEILFYIYDDGTVEKKFKFK